MSSSPASCAYPSLVKQKKLQHGHNACSVPEFIWYLATTSRQGNLLETYVSRLDSFLTPNLTAACRSFEGGIIWIFACHVVEGKLLWALSLSCQYGMASDFPFFLDPSVSRYSRKKCVQKTLIRATNFFTFFFVDTTSRWRRSKGGGVVWA